MAIGFELQPRLPIRIGLGDFPLAQVPLPFGHLYKQPQPHGWDNTIQSNPSLHKFLFLDIVQLEDALIRRRSN